MRREPAYPQTLADVARLLSCEVRLEVLISALQSTRTSVGALASELDLDQPLVSTHLSILRAAGILSCTGGVWHRLLPSTVIPRCHRPLL